MSVGTPTKTHTPGMNAVRPHHAVHKLVGVVDKKNKKPARGCIQRSAVTDLDQVELALYGFDYRGKRDSRRLVDEQKAVEILKHPKLNEICHLNLRPKFFKCVVGARFRREDVHHDVDKVGNNPSRFGVA